MSAHSQLDAELDKRQNGGPPEAELTPWPEPLATEAFYGLAGEVVHAIEPHTEADPAALLVSLLVAYGAAVGRGPHILRGDAQHGPNEYVVIVGETSVGAKDTAWSAVRRLIRGAAPDLPIASGLVSGEGLVHHVRDPREERRKAKGNDAANADDDGFITEVVDPGADDKRLLIVESEFVRVLNAAGRPDNTLSAVLRLLWDSGDAQTLAKNSKDRATGGHVAMVALITPSELRERLGAVDVLNGFVNRFAFVCSRRSKLLPDGGSVPYKIANELAEKIADTFRISRSVLEMDLSADAQELWREHYERLRTPPEGMVGAAMARAAVHVLRFAVIYALLDGRAKVHREHLDAALAVWRYCEQSALFLFAEATGNPLADRILHALRLTPAGLTRSEISADLDHNAPANRIEEALGALLVRGVVSREWEETGGRPAQRWHAGGTSS